MSAWYIFSALGFYPVNPANSVYVLGSPLFSQAAINLENGNKFIVKALNNSRENIYIRSARLNGVPYNKSFITHSHITRGGVLELEMDSKPNFEFGAAPENRLKSVMNN